MSDLLCARDLTHRFGANRVLDGVGFALRAGELRIVLGPNGSGKSTLVRIASGVLRPLRGEVRLGDRPLESMARRNIARSLAVVSQGLEVPFPFRVREMVAMGRTPWLGAFGRGRRHDREVTENALVSLGLQALAERAFPTLSAGEKQRVVLARAVTQEAPVLLLDEPTAHMDLGHRVRVFEWLREWITRQQRERAVLLVTHDLVLAARFADRVLLLERGRPVAEGSPREVLTPERIGSVYRVDAKVSEDGSGRPVIIAGRSRIRYTA